MDKNINISIQAGLKYCPRCKQYKPTTDFYSHGKSGIASYCKECDNEYHRNRFHLKKAELEAMKQVILLHKMKEKSKSHFDITSMDDNALLKELKGRGYIGTLKYNKTINL